MYKDCSLELYWVGGKFGDVFVERLFKVSFESSWIPADLTQQVSTVFLATAWTRFKNSEICWLSKLADSNLTILPSKFQSRLILLRFQA